MLILTRCVGETLIIGAEVQVMVIGVKGGQVRLGISAPKNVAIVKKSLSAGNAQPQVQSIECVNRAEQKKHMQVPFI